MQIFLRLISQDRPQLRAAELRRWPKAFVDELRRLKLIEQAPDGRYVECPGCDVPQVCEVRSVWLEEQRDPRLIATCRGCGPFTVARADLEVSRPSPAGIAELVGRGLGLTHAPDEIVQGQLWSCGYVVIGGARVVRTLVSLTTVLDEQWVRPGDLIFTGGSDEPSLTGVTARRLADLLRWEPDVGITVDPRVLSALVGAGTDSIELDGFVAPTLVLEGRGYIVRNLTPDESKLLAALAPNKSTQITSLFGEGATSLWNGDWRPSDTRCARNVRSRTSALNGKLFEAGVPFHFSVRANHGVGERKPGH